MPVHALLALVVPVHALLVHALLVPVHASARTAGAGGASACVLLAASWLGQVALHLHLCPVLEEEPGWRAVAFVTSILCGQCQFSTG